MEEDAHPRPWQYALAAILGASLLGTTYALFDPDLGTPVPLFQEFTCGRTLQVIVSDASGAPVLHTPQMALRMQAWGGGALRPAFFELMIRERGESWRTYYSAANPEGDHLMAVEITNATEVYALAKDLEGRYCKGRSDVLTTTSSEPPETSASRSP